MTDTQECKIGLKFFRVASETQPGVQVWLVQKNYEIRLNKAHNPASLFQRGGCIARKSPLRFDGQYAKTKAAPVSVASNSVLVKLKPVIGIFSGSVSIISEAIHSANDLPAATIAEIEKIIKSEPRVVSRHRMRTRKSGSQRHIDFHIVMPAEATLVEAHQIADELEKLIAQRFAMANVVIHVDPYDVEKEGKTSTPPES